VPDPLRDCIAFRLGSAFRRADRMLNRRLDALDLTHAHAQVLACLLHEGGLRVADVAARTGFEASTVSRLARDLSRRRLIRRRKHPHDARCLMLSAAKRGEALREELTSLLRRAHLRLTEDLPQADLDGFLNTTARIDELP